MQQELFEIRDELFLLAMNHPKKFGFCNSDYVFFREMFNNAIRYADKNNVLSMMIAIFILRTSGLEFDSAKYWESLYGKAENHPKEISSQLLNFLGRYDDAIYKYMNRTSIIHWSIFRLWEIKLLLRKIKIRTQKIKIATPVSTFVKDAEYAMTEKQSAMAM